MQLQERVLSLRSATHRRPIGLLTACLSDCRRLNAIAKKSAEHTYTESRTEELALLTGMYYKQHVIFCVAHLRVACGVQLNQQNLWDEKNRNCKQMIEIEKKKRKKGVIISARMGKGNRGEDVGGGSQVWNFWKHQIQ